MAAHGWPLPRASVMGPEARPLLHHPLPPPPPSSPPPPPPSSPPPPPISPAWHWFYSVKSAEVPWPLLPCTHLPILTLTPKIRKPSTHLWSKLPTLLQSTATSPHENPRYTSDLPSTTKTMEYHTLLCNTNQFERKGVIFNPKISYCRFCLAKYWNTIYQM